MDLRQLRYFRAVVENRSFSAAAKALHMTQPSLSLAVRELEKSFGATLLRRGRQGVSLTPEGEIVYATSRGIHDHLAQAEAEVRALRKGTAGSVRLSVAPEYNWMGLAELIGYVRRSAPTLEITILDPDPTQSIENIYQGKADIGIIPNSNPAGFAARHEPVFGVRPILDLPMAVAIPTSWGIDSPTVDLAELAHHTWLIPVADSWFEGLPELLVREWAANPATRPTDIIRVSTLQTALPLVASEVGIAIVPELTETIAPRGVSIYPLSNAITPLTLLAFWNQQRPITPSTQRFIDALEELHPVVPPR